MQNEISILSELLLKGASEAKEYLFRFNEFYPFGGVWEINHGYKSVSIYEGEDFPSATSVLNHLTEQLSDKISKREIVAYVICVNVRYESVALGRKTEAIELRVNYRGTNYLSSYVPYEKINEAYVYYDIEQA